MTPDEIAALDAFVGRLLEVRQSRGLSRHAVARLVPVASGSVIGNWETGHRRPIDHLLQAWAAALAVEVPAGVHGWRLP
jgi:transcriptional regulator with XRE-family HTH domain